MTASLRWIKSSYSENGGQCIEWAPEHAHTHGAVPVRDSKNPQRPALLVPALQWAHFVEYAKGQSV
ncbi:protein of unknown function [Streptomyces sp. 2224.1]|uniref:DUF397 domain-containing protein n=1 Tax=Streptomyces sp. 2224.1 TaxID=1881020 RepID=UPI000898470F|nr:DUF397 domain-containing protein [Streptomyces sp. 2224.1]SEB77412.1 protein of unknown function [Streptomyces sp. 2224.1]